MTLAPESSFAPLAEVVNDHRPYIASALGLSVILAWIIDRAAAFIVGQKQRLPAFIAASLILSAAAIPLNRYRTWQWSDSLRIWEDTTRKSPNNGRAWMNTGLAYMGRGDLISARRYFERARDLNPGYAFVHMNLSVLEANEGHLEKALAEAEQAVRLRPDLSLTHFYLGQALERMNRANEAAVAYERALQLDPRYDAARAALALTARARPARSDGAGSQALQEQAMKRGLDLLYARSDPIGAVKDFRKVLEQNPNHYGATFQIAMALDRSGQSKEARPFWEKMLKMAEAVSDKETIATARTRLAKDDFAGSSAFAATR